MWARGSKCWSFLWLADKQDLTESASDMQEVEKIKNMNTKQAAPVTPTQWWQITSLGVRLTLIWEIHPASLLSSEALNVSSLSKKLGSNFQSARQKIIWESEPLVGSGKSYSRVSITARSRTVDTANNQHPIVVFVRLITESQRQEYRFKIHFEKFQTKLHSAVQSPTGSIRSISSDQSASS